MKALVAMLSVKKGMPFPELPRSEPVPLAVARTVEGRYTNQTRGFELMRNGTNLTFLWQGGGFPQTIRQYRGDLASDGPIGFGMQLLRQPNSDSISIGGTEYRRAPVGKPNPLPERWRPLLGEYGWDHDILYILEKNGKLH